MVVDLPDPFGRAGRRPRGRFQVQVVDGEDLVAAQKSLKTLVRATHCTTAPGISRWSCITGSGRENVPGSPARLSLFPWSGLRLCRAGRVISLQALRKDDLGDLRTVQGSAYVSVRSRDTKIVGGAGTPAGRPGSVVVAGGLLDDAIANDLRVADGRPHAAGRTCGEQPLGSSRFFIMVAELSSCAGGRLAGGGFAAESANMA